MLRKILYFVLCYITILFAGLLYLDGARAGDVFELREVAVEYRNHFLLSEFQRNALIYPEPPKDGLDVDLRVSVIRYFGWDSIVHSVTTDGQFRGIGLHMRTYLNLTQEISFGHDHHSQHVLDREHPAMRFPAEDSVFVRLCIHCPKYRESLF
jgi:hypothetical protein